MNNTPSFSPFYVLLLILFTACTERAIKDQREPDPLFGEVRSLNELNASVFLPSLEAPIDIKKNNIYAATLPMAWHELRSVIGDSIIFIASEELQLIDRNRTYRDVLDKDEFVVNTKIEGPRVSASVYFHASLPYLETFTLHQTPLKFDTSQVRSFGHVGPHYAYSIVYYENDNDFAIRLHTEKYAHEMVLIKKSFVNPSNFIEELKTYEEKRITSKRSNPDHWKNEVRQHDSLSIPVTCFNLKNYFKEIEGTKFITPHQVFTIDTVYQRIAFLLNESGAKVESEAKIEAAAEAMTYENEEETQKDKKLIFDSQFMIFFRKSSAKHPYFAMLVSNTELLDKIDMNPH